MPAKMTSDSHGVLKRGCSRRKISGIWRYVAIEYVMRDAPITPALVAMNEDRRRQHADVDLEPVEQATLDAEVLDEPEDRVVRVAALLRRQREQRRVLAVDQLHGQRRERDGGEREVDREHRERRRACTRSGRCAPGRGPPRRGWRPSPRPCRRASRWGSRWRGSTTSVRRPSGCCSASTSGLSTSTNPITTSSSWVAKSITASVIDSLAASVTPTMFERDEDDDHDRAADDVPRVRAQRLPEDREVVRHEERRHGDRDDVDEHLRPAGGEADELVERVAREARGAAGLRETRRPLRVGRAPSSRTPRPATTNTSGVSPSA